LCFSLPKIRGNWFYGERVDRQQELGQYPQEQALDRRLSEAQTRALNAACTTQTGLATIQGRSGSGKSETLAGIGDAQIHSGDVLGNTRFGEKSRFVGPALTAADNDQFQLPPLNSEDGTAVQHRFAAETWRRRNARLALKAEEKILVELPETLRPLWRLANETNGTHPRDKHKFPVRFQARVRQWTSTQGPSEDEDVYMKEEGEVDAHPMAHQASTSCCSSPSRQPR
jgi:hypothetical protein